MALKIYQIKDGVYHIHESMDVFCSLVIGKKRALLIDTGYGFGNIKKTVSGLTKLPILVLNTHGHLDHVQGNSAFKEVMIHPLDIALRKKHTSLQFRLVSWVLAKKQGANLRDISLLNHVKVDSSSVTAINDGEQIDLGGVTLEIIWTAGHTMGSVCVLDKTNRILFSGDSFSSLVWLFLKEACDIPCYIKSTKKLLSRIADFDEIISSHSAARFSASFLERILHCAENINPEKSTMYDSKIAGKALLYTEGLDRLEKRYGLKSFAEFMSIAKKLSAEEVAALELCAIAYRPEQLTGC
ncbi:hypothetical protein MASR2M29_13990 [Spirochaetota bacterium]